MKIYYIPEININNININTLKVYKKIIQKIIITPYGRIIIKENNKAEKLIINESSVINDFIPNYTLFINDINWNKCNLNDICNKNEFLEKNIYEIKLSDFSSSSLFIEFIDDKINDLYFTSKNDPDTIFFKNDISSFIKMLI